MVPQLGTRTIPVIEELLREKRDAYRDKLKLQKQGLMHDLLTGKKRIQ
jgi:hypothetical protein